MKKLILSLAAICFILLNAEAKKIKNKFVVIETTMGTIKLELFADVPQHSENFLKLVKEGFYDSTLFHRVIPNFMIQGGDPQSKNAPDGQMLGNGDVGYRVPAEFMTEKYYHKKGALCAARDNNPEKASSGCQFYIVVGKKYTDEELNSMEGRTGVRYTEQARNDYKTLGGTPFLDGGYTVYGQLVEGQEIVDAISMVERNGSDRPNVNVRVLSAKVKKK
jgi:peptidyl-prolyl cis-trans isomerase B (cyclophilin B)